MLGLKYLLGIFVTRMVLNVNENYQEYPIISCQSDQILSFSYCDTGEYCFINTFFGLMKLQ